MVEVWVYQALDLAEPEQRTMLEALIKEHGDLGRVAAELVAAHDHITHFLDPPFWNDLQLKSKYLIDGSSLPEIETSVLGRLGKVLAFWHDREKTGKGE